MIPAHVTHTRQRRAQQRLAPLYDRDDNSNNDNDETFCSHGVLHIVRPTVRPVMPVKLKTKQTSRNTTYYTHMGVISRSRSVEIHDVNTRSFVRAHAAPGRNEAFFSKTFADRH